MTAPKYRTSMDAAFDAPRPPAEENLDALPLFAVPEPVRTAPGDRTAEEEGQTRARSSHEQRHAALLDRLRTHARELHARTGRPVSANDVRHLVAEELLAGHEVDRRVLGQVFTGKRWQRVGSVETACDGATAARVGASRSMIGTYVPVDGEAE